MLKSILGKDSYLVGGSLRDAILGRKVKDLDIVYVGEKDNFQRIIRKLSSKYPIFPLDKIRDIWRCKVGEELTVDLSKADDIFSDIKRRDFTINSLAIKMSLVKIKIKKGFFEISFSDKDLIDLTSKGVRDIKNGVIRQLDNGIIDDDPLRIMRAFRFASQFNFKLHPDLKNVIFKKKSLINNVAKERIREELVKSASTDNFYLATKLMVDTGILFELFPEFEKQLDCATVYYGKGGVLKHTMNVIERLDRFFISPMRYSSISKDLYPKLYEERYLIKLAGLFHDIAKPATAKIRGDRLRFFGHENLGAQLTKGYLSEFRFSNKEIRYIECIIKNHLRIGSFACNDPITQRAISRIFYDLGDYTLGLLVLSWADYASHISKRKLEDILEETKKNPQAILKKLPPNSLRRTIRFMQVVNLLFRDYLVFSKVSNIKPFLNGNEIMKILSLSPGPIIGEIKKRLINLQLEGKIKTKEEAFQYIKSLGKNLSF